jgi:GTP-binding protein
LKSFPDEAEITVKAGKGGAGCVSFARTRFQPRGRPDGGDGGAGGHIFLEASPNLRTLAPFKRRRAFAAQAGGRGRGQDRRGRGGEPLIIKVPLGTLVFDLETGELLADLLTPGERLLLARGGRGGKGNAHFVSSRFRSPRLSQPGEPGVERRLRLELQILADIGLVGAPNAGKSSLLRALTHSRARVAPFPFTTLSPQLGVLTREEGEPLVLAEIPGLIPGAHLGKGLGHRFLRHLKRTRILVQVLDLSQIDPEHPLAPLEMLEQEMAAFDPILAAKPRVLALNKTDLLDPEFPRAAVLRAYQDTGRRVFPVSARTGDGLDALQQALWEAVAALDQDILPESNSPEPT